MQAEPIVLDFDTPPEDFPLGERIVLRDSIAFFESQPSVDADIRHDTEFLAKLPSTLCYYGARDCQLYPFICVPESPYRDLPYASVVLRDLRADNFRSEHIKNLDTISIPYPGYAPGTENDEIHTETGEQAIFQKTDDLEKDDDGNAIPPHKSLLWHSELQSYVLNSHIYYVLLHTKPYKYEDCELSDIVILFAVGVSPQTGNLVGAVTHQVCHNYCDWIQNV